MEESKVIVWDEKGEKHEGEILFTFEANGDNFVLYSLGENAFAAKIDGENKLSSVNKDEWPLIEKIYNEWLEEQGEEK